MDSLTVEITLFDDGNEKFSTLHNRWMVTKQMFNGGKYALKNIDDPTVTLRSISSWKTKRIYGFSSAPPPGTCPERDEDSGSEDSGSKDVWTEKDNMFGYAGWELAQYNVRSGGGVDRKVTYINTVVFPMLFDKFTCPWMTKDKFEEIQSSWKSYRSKYAFGPALRAGDIIQKIAERLTLSDGENLIKTT